MRLTKAQASDNKMRFRNWQSILYPDSAPPDWRERLTNWGIQAFASPLHDQDKNGDGEPKKPHHHIILMFANKKAWWQVDQIFDDIGALHGWRSDGKSAFITAEDLRVAARYLLHLDNPEKALYSEDDLQSWGGADFSEIATLPSDDDEIMGEILQWIHDYRCFSYRALIMYARDNEPKWFKYLNHKGSRHVYQVLKSAQWELEHVGMLVLDPTKERNEDGVLVDRHTGEIIKEDDQDVKADK